MKRICLAIWLACLAAWAFGVDEPRRLTVTGLDGFDGQAITIAVLKDLIPRAGGSGTVAGGAVTAPLLSPKDRVTPWTGGGSQTVWVVLGDVAANKGKKDKTAGLTARMFAGVDFDDANVTIRWGDGKALPAFDLEEFVEHY